MHRVPRQRVALASYELTAVDDEQAKADGRQYLDLHSSIEVWQGPRWVARFARDDGAAPRLCGR